MNRKEKVAIGLYILTSLVTIGVLLGLLMKKDKDEKYDKCVCASAGYGHRVCQNTDIAQAMYQTGLVTENTNTLPKSRGWTSVSPGDINYPVSKDCGWSNSVLKKGMAAWSSPTTFL